MTTTPTTHQATSKGTKPNNAKAGSWVKQHKAMVLLGIVAVIALWTLTRKTAAQAQGQQGGPTSSDPYGLAGMPYGPTAADPYGGSGLTDPNSVAGLMEQLLAGQAGLGDQLNSLLANPGDASTTTAKGGGHHGKSGHNRNGQKHGSHKGNGHGGHHQGGQGHSHGTKPKVGGTRTTVRQKAKRSTPPFATHNPTRPTARQRQAVARQKTPPRRTQPIRRK